MTSKLFITAVTLVFASVTFSGAFSGAARADSCPPDLNSVVGLVKAGIGGIHATSVYESETGTTTLSDESLLRMNEIAKIQSGIWADTILEGDYFANGATELDEVVQFARNGTVVAYRITYSERAWDTSDCSFDSDELETLSACVQGRIVESTFVSGDLTRFMRDLDDLANFNE